MQVRLESYKSRYELEAIHLILDVLEDELGFTGYVRPDLDDISKTYFKNERSHFWLAFSGDELVGTIGLLKKSDDHPHLKRLIVKKEFRGQGLGVRLLETALDYARERGVKRVYAGTVPENKMAIGFYKKYGFEEHDEVPEDITAASDSICFKYDLGDMLS